MLTTESNTIKIANKTIMKKLNILIILILGFHRMGGKEVAIDLLYSTPQTFTVTATVYHAVPEQCNADPSHTASMFKLDLNNPYKHKVIAVSRDLRKHFPYGTLVRIKGTDYDQIFRVEDTMNKRYTNRIDILINKGMPLGKWYNVTIRKV